MSIQSAVYSKLQSLCSNRVYAQIAPQGAPMPRITFQVISAQPQPYLLGTGGLIKYEVQFDSWGADSQDATDTLTACRNLIENNRNVLWGTETITSCFTSNQIDSYELNQDGLEMPAFRATMQATIWMVEKNY